MHAGWDGAPLGLWLCATNVPPPLADQKGWLYDVTCLRYDNDWLNRREILLVAQINWVPKYPYCENFVELLVARAKVRVMVYLMG